MSYLPDELLSKKVANLNECASLGDGAVDWEVGIHCPHLVQVALDKISLRKAHICIYVYDMDIVH